jgi:hypothetical protein
VILGFHETNLCFKVRNISKTHLKTSFETKFPENTFMGSFECSYVDSNVHTNIVHIFWVDLNVHTNSQKMWTILSIFK